MSKNPATLGAIPNNQKDILGKRGGYQRVKKINPKAYKAQGLLNAIQQNKPKPSIAGGLTQSAHIHKYDGVDGGDASAAGTSIFDPVLCELIYRWFCPQGGSILDPFAGGSVRGIVAAFLGYDYTGIDLSARQIQANEQQAAEICQDKKPHWIVGDSRNLPALVTGEYDLIFSCPPYYDLEVYSEDESDLSTFKTYADFLEVYREIISHCIARLKENRFACFVVGDVRDKKGFYRNFVADTISAFQDCGAMLYNDAILITSVGSLPIRVGKQFGGYRKLGKTHQNVLIFFKGNPKTIKQTYGEMEIPDVFETNE